MDIGFIDLDVVFVFRLLLSAGCKNELLLITAERDTGRLLLLYPKTLLVCGKNLRP